MPTRRTIRAANLVGPIAAAVAALATNACGQEVDLASGRIGADDVGSGSAPAARAADDGGAGAKHDFPRGLDAGTDAAVDAGDAADDVDAGHDASAEASDASDSAVDVGNDAGEDATDAAVEGGADSSTDAQTLDACAPEHPDVQKGVFVSLAGSHGPCGTDLTPCDSIQTGIDLAAQTGKTSVYVDGGMYVEQIVLREGLTVQGGWSFSGGAWTRRCGRRSADVTVQAPPSASATVIASFNGSSALDTLTVASKPSAAAGESIYGIFAAGASTTLVLTAVDVDVIGGGAGAIGAMGPAGAPGSPSGCAPSMSYSPGLSGAQGGGAPNGDYDALGFHARSGAWGTDGSSGSSGFAGASASCITECVACDCATSACAQTGGTWCGSAGLAGCGGLGGRGGAPGAGGGSSIGIFAWDATVSFGAIEIVAGNGGPGGDGGGGGFGGPGGWGVPGQSTPLLPVGCHENLGGGGCVPDQGAGSGGGPGTAGAPGGSGGSGGGGAGGDSFCWYAGASASILGAASCTPGIGGAGGNANSVNHGADGRAGVHN